METYRSTNILVNAINQSVFRVCLDFSQKDQNNEGLAESDDVEVRSVKFVCSTCLNYGR